ncbi:hypothetical protein [Microbacterium sp.]|uniref:hypothetical protein n=1 Tax=Microbacterium sp. TaxID=51671 RepID=UPI0039E497B2
MYALLWLATATPTPSPSPTLIDPDRVTPGVAGFIGIAVIAIAVVLLLIDMQRRIRRARYRSEIAEQLDAEAADARDGDADGTSLTPPSPAKE